MVSIIGSINPLRYNEEKRSQSKKATKPWTQQSYTMGAEMP